MTKHRTAALCAAVALAAIAPAATSQIVLEVSAWVPPSHPLVTEMTIPLCKDIEAATQSRVSCRMLPKAVASPPGTFDAIRDGIADVSFIVHGYTPGRFPLAEAVELPFMADSAEAMSVAYQRVYDRQLARFEEHKGVLTLGVFTHGPGQIYNTRRPVAAIRDFEGLKLRIASGVVADVTKALGATAVLKPASESYELISSGIVDGTLLPKESPVGLNLMRVLKHATYVPGGLYNVSFAVIGNPRKWSQMTPADRDAVGRLTGEALARRYGRAWDAADARGIKAVADNNIQVVNASPQLVADIKARTAGLEQAWIDKVKAKGADGRAILDALRTEIAALQKK
ncbi:MAG: TRAP transporter substrate-binding protein [Burkholderiales bacterium]|nr:TRAP transporter substrate-binding protein [Burkholderiales bacterium]